MPNRHLIRVHSCPFVVQNTTSFVVHSWFQTPLHSWFKTTEPKVAFTPHPRPLSPSRGKRCPAVISGQSPSCIEHATHPCPTPHLIRVHSCPFVVQNRHSIRVHSWFQTSPHSCSFVSIRGSKHHLIRVHSWFQTAFHSWLPPPPFVTIRGF